MRKAFGPPALLQNFFYIELPLAVLAAWALKEVLNLFQLLMLGAHTERRAAKHHILRTIDCAQRSNLTTSSKILFLALNPVASFVARTIVSFSVLDAKALLSRASLLQHRAILGPIFLRLHACTRCSQQAFLRSVIPIEAVTSQASTALLNR